MYGRLNPFEQFAKNRQHHRLLSASLPTVEMGERALELSEPTRNLGLHFNGLRIADIGIQDRVLNLPLQVDDHIPTVIK